MNSDDNMEEIYQKGKEIYPIDIECDEKLDSIYTINDWAEVFYNMKKGKMKERFIYLMQNSEYSQFFKGLNYEYGINNFPKDINKAFNIYKTAADNGTDCIAMFRMYHIYKNDFIKFNIKTRQRILEKFYLFKCFCYSKYPIMQRTNSLCNRFDIKYEVSIHFDYEDEDKEKFLAFIEHIKQYCHVYNINKDDIHFIECVMKITFISSDEMDIYEELSKLDNMKNGSNLEVNYKIICLNKLLSDESKEEEFKILYNNKFYKSYVDYALFLNNKKRPIEALKILAEARNNGILSAGFIYFDIYLDNHNFNELMKDASNFSPKCELYNLFQILIDDINLESVFSFYEYFFFLKICSKHYNLEYMLNVYFQDYTKEIIDFLINLTKDTFSSKELVKTYFCEDDFYKEYNLACGVIHFYGMKNVLKRDLDKALHHIKIAYGCNSSDSYKRFCYFYIYKIKKIFFEEKRLKVQDKKSKNKLIPMDSSFLVTDIQMNIIKNKLFEDYHKSLQDNADNLSSSYYYYLSRLYHNKIGNKGDKMMEYLCLKKAVDYRNPNPGSGSIISFYRKYKASIIVEKNKAEWEYLFSHSLNKIDSEGYGEKGDICPICFDKKRNTLSLPCKHLFCQVCINKLERCPICRHIIMVRFPIG